MRAVVGLGVVLTLVLPAGATAQISPGPLARAHAELEGAGNCVKCHSGRAAMTQLCLDCHKEIRWGMDAGRGLHAREAKDPRTSCASCHPDHAGRNFALVAWKEGSAERFDHRRAGWALEGKHSSTVCDKCHRASLRVSPAAALSKRRGSAGWIGLETDCASCHRADDQHKGTLGPKCESCHDSRGWQPAPKFAHAQSRYPLTGKHRDVECDKCHLAAQLKLKPDSTGKVMPQFKPLVFAECSACHADPHQGRLASKCSSCHNTRGFASVDKKDFNHAATRYPLQGRHRAVACEACHGVGNTKRTPAFGTCATCHADRHRGEATLAGKVVDCAACHQVEGFAPATFTVAQHQATAFALSGKHQQVRCAACHTPVGAPSPSAAGATHPGALPAVVRIRMPFARCTSCHEDSHGGQLAARAGKGACEECHRDTGWKPSVFSVEAHGRLRLPLEGRHAEIPCASCHAVTRTGLPPVSAPASRGKAGFLFAVPEIDCASCHVDPHGGRFTAKGGQPVNGGCRACHDARSFRPSTVDVARHAAFKFPLEGAHRALACVACHARLNSSLRGAFLVRAPSRPPALVLTADKGTACQACHESPHGDQFAGRKSGGQCESCHGTETFVPATRFDHEQDASFSLEGAHAKLPCASCHKAASVPAGSKQVVYRPLSSKCESCHAAKPAGGGK